MLPAPDLEINCRIPRGGGHVHDHFNPDPADRCIARPCGQCGEDAAYGQRGKWWCQRHWLEKLRADQLNRHDELLGQP
jgi:hypothetical protein